MARAARERFAELLAGPDESLGVAEAALCIAAEHVALDVDECLAQLQELAERARPALDEIATRPLSVRVDQFGQHMFRDEGFRGCEQGDYYQPSHSFLNEVLNTKVGIPITLSIVYVDVARRLGLHAYGVGFPGHFLVKVEPGPETGPESNPGSSTGDEAVDRAGDGDAGILIDPFAGRPISPEECAAHLKRALGPQAKLDAGWLRAAAPREILHRVLANLKQNYLAVEDWPSALSCADRSLLIAPDSPLELRDRGILYQRLECFGPAIEDLERFLELAPQHETADVIRKALSGLRGRKSTLH